MIVAKNDEEKRSKLWHVTMVVSTLVIIAVGIYFITRMFVANPLEGTWVYEDRDIILVFADDGEATIQGSDLFDDSGISLALRYTFDASAKTITIKSDQKEFQQVMELFDGADTAEYVLGTYGMTFDYSIENQQLTLSEREYGSNLVFIKK